MVSPTPDAEANGLTTSQDAHSTVILLKPLPFIFISCRNKYANGVDKPENE